MNKREQVSGKNVSLHHAVIAHAGQNNDATDPAVDPVMTPDLFRALTESHTRLKLMARVTSAAIDATPVTAQVQEIADQVRAAFGASACVVRSLEDTHLVLLAASGIPAEQLHERIPADFGIIPDVIEGRQAVFVPDVRTDSRTAQAQQAVLNSFEFTSYAGAPLLHNDEAIGILAVYSVSDSLSFSPEDLEDLQILANHVTVALVNERLYRDLQRRTNELQEQIAARKSSEAKYRSIFENATEGIFQSTPEGRFVEANPAMARIYGYESPAALIASINDIRSEVYVDPERRSQLQALLARDGAVKDFESQIRRQDGKLIWISSHVRVVKNSEGQALYYEGTVEDITARKQAEEDLRRSEHRFRALIENSSDVIAVIDANGTVKYVSPSVERVVGYRPDERLGDGSYTHLHPDDLDISRGAIQQAMQAPGESVHFQVRVQHKEGHWINLDSVARNLLDDPMVQGIVINTRDITSAKRQEAALATAYEAEKLARHSAELHAEQLRRLQVVTAALSTAVSAAEVARVIVDVGVAALRSASGVLGLLADDGKHVNIVHHIGYPPGSVEPYMRFRLGLPVPLSQAIETRQTIIISSGVEAAARYPIISFPESPCRSLVSIPLLVDNRCLGAIVFRYEEEHKFTSEDRAFLRNLGEQAAQALDRARLYDAEQRSREQAEAEVNERKRTEARLHRQNARLASLHRIDMAISSGFELQNNLAVYLQEVATQLNIDAADILLCSADGSWLEFAAGSEPWMAAGLRQRGADALIRAAIYSRQTVQQSLSVAENPWSRSGHSAGWSSYFAVPLMARNEPCGVLELYKSGSIEADEEWIDFLATLSGQGAIAIDNSRLVAQLVAAYDATIEGWSRALDLRDKETEGHSRRVTEMTVRLAKALEVEEHMLEHIRRGALLHDIGKMGVPDSILLKPAELTHDEQTEMRRHPSYAFELLSPITFLKPALDIPYYHHEKWDGTGYPRGLRGEEIPLAARIFAVADVWDALNSDRPYRARWPRERVRAHIASLSGTHFDPRVVEAFLQLEGES